MGLRLVNHCPRLKTDRAHRGVGKGLALGAIGLGRDRATEVRDRRSL